MSFAGVSVVADGWLEPSAASAIHYGTDSGSGYHLLVVEGYSRAKDTPNCKGIKGRPFRFAGYRWFLEFYPNGDWLGSADFISIFLTLDHDIARPVKPVKVHLGFSFIDQVDKQKPAHISATKPYDFSSSDRSCGVHFIRRKALEKSKHLKDDSFTIRCDFTVADSVPPYIEVPCSNICQHLNQLLEAKIGSDVTFKVGGETFPDHRCVLAARSSVFTAELCGPMKEGTADSIIQIQDMEAEVFEALLRFIYTDSLPKIVEVGKAQVMWLQHLLVAADRYALLRLKSMCEEQLSERIDVSSVATILALAGKHHCPGLKKACLEFLKVQSSTALQKVMATSDWEHILASSPSILNELIAKLASKV